MEQELALRPFVPAKDFEKSRKLYEVLGFRATHNDKDVCIIQNHCQAEWADNRMLQLLVRDVEPWWPSHVDAEKLVAEFGLMVGFIVDPSGLLLHVAEARF